MGRKVAAPQYVCADVEVVAHFVVAVGVADLVAQQLVGQRDAAAGFQRGAEIQRLRGRQQFHREHGIGSAALRVGCIMDGDTMVDKYGRRHQSRGVSLIDRRDIGEVARLCIELPDLEWEVFYLYGTPEGPKELDVQYTTDRLGWKPKYDFSWLPAWSGEAK